RSPLLPPQVALLRRGRLEDRALQAGVRREDELLPLGRRRSDAPSVGCPEHWPAALQVEESVYRRVCLARSREADRSRAVGNAARREAPGESEGYPADCGRARGRACLIASRGVA